MKQNQPVSFTKWLVKPIWVVLCLLVFVACKKEIQPPTNEAGQDQSLSTMKAKAKIQVIAGSSIQAAVDAASPGDIIKIAPGIYKEAVVVNKPNIKLVGTGDGDNGVIIENPGNANDGMRVRSDGDGFEMYNITLKNFKENGVVLIRADNFVLDHITTINCGEYGLWPIRSNNGVIKHCTATGHTDSGIYTGQSENITMRFNIVYGNTIGLEIENCKNVTATNNQCYDNVAGMLCVLLPGLSVTSASDINISRNHVYNNNKVNTANPADGFEAFVPSGSGILVVGTDKTTVANNTVQNNNFLGIAVVSTVVLGSLAGLPPEAFAGIEPNADWAKVSDNVANTNGKVQPPLPFPASDLLWDGSGIGNCWSSNNFKTSFPKPLPVCN